MSQTFVDICHSVGEFRRADTIVDEVLTKLLGALPALVQVCDGEPETESADSDYPCTYPHALSFISAKSHANSVSEHFQADGVEEQGDEKSKVALLQDYEVIHAVELAKSMQHWSFQCEHSTADFILPLSR